MVKCKHCKDSFDDHSKLGAHLRVSSIKCPEGYEDKEYKEECIILYKIENAENKIDDANKKKNNNVNTIDMLKKENTNLDKNIKTEEEKIDELKDELKEMKNKHKNSKIKKSSSSDKNIARK
jgi:hypothetical protein